MITTDDLIGRMIDSVEVSRDKELLTVSMKDGTVRQFRAVGGCCSSSWIEHLEIPDDIAGAILLSVDDSEGVTMDNDDYETIRVYNTAFRTNRGDIIVEYRNSSNGYYGGWLEDVTP